MSINIDDKAFEKIHDALDRQEGVTLSAGELVTLYAFAEKAINRAHAKVQKIMTIVEDLELVAGRDTGTPGAAAAGRAHSGGAQ